MTSSQSITRHFDAKAASYAAAAARGPWAWQRAREEDAVVTLVGRVIGRDALDLGCGVGFYARRLMVAGAKSVVAVDISRAMIAQLPGGIEGVVGDATSIDLGRTFDIIIVAGLLEFVPSPEIVIANATKHLHERGRLVVLVPTLTVGGFGYQLYHRSHGIRISLFSKSRIGDLAVKVGLRIASSSNVPPFTSVYGLARE